MTTTFLRLAALPLLAVTSIACPGDRAGDSAAAEAAVESQPPPRRAGAGSRAATQDGAADVRVATTPPAKGAPRQAGAVRAEEEMTLDEVPVAMRSCFGCHAGVVRTFLLDHGMAASVGPAGAPEPGSVTNPRSGNRYTLSVETDGTWLTTTLADGGRRRQRVVGRIGAGIHANSWVTAESDVLTGETSGRLFFAPVETVRGHGLVLAPFDHHDGSPAPHMELTQACLTCHVTDDLGALPAAAVGGAGTLFPSNALGARAFEQLRGIGCEACHGDASFHERLMAGSDPPIGTGLVALGDLPAASQRDVCGRCHLQGDSRWPLLEGAPTTAVPLPAQVPVLVPVAAQADFRFVGQLERLELSACFRATPAMTCTTCHDPHTGADAQGTGSFEAACAACHQAACSRPPELTVAEVTGAPARGSEGCVDCHLRRSQPFDLTEIRSVDHWIRRRIPPPVSGAPHRQFADPNGPLRLFDRHRLAAVLDTPGGIVWERAVRAMGLTSMGRFDEAAQLFDTLPSPGEAAAVRPVAPSPLRSVLDRGDLHRTRALVLLGTGRAVEARAAFGDALKLDPADPAARLGRARLRLDLGDVVGVLEDTQVVIDAFPRAEHPWRLRLELAERARRFDLARSALEAITARWPSDPVAWQKLGLVLEQEGDERAAAEALSRARLLRPGLDLRPPPEG